MSSFGALTDHFKILAIADGGGTLANKLKLTASQKTPAQDSRADARDENNDIAASTFYGAGDISSASCTYSLVSGELDTSLIKLGEVVAKVTGGEPVEGVFIQSVNITTDQNGWPQIVVNGTLGAEKMVAPPDSATHTFKNTFTMPEYTIVARKQAQLIGFTAGAGCKLTSSGISASVELAQAEDGLGEPAAHGVSGGVVDVSASFVRITAAPSWEVTGSGLTEDQVPGATEGQAAYHTATGSAKGTLVRDSETL